MSAEDAPVDLSVVVPVYGQAAMALKCIAHIDRALRAAQNLTSEIVIADDKSPDGTADAIEAGAPHVRLIRGDVNLGFGGNANRGVQAARGRWVCLLNSDMFVDEQYFLGCAASGAAKAPSEGGLGPGETAPKAAQPKTTAPAANSFDDPELFAVAGRILEPSGANDGLKRLELGPRGARVHAATRGDPRGEVEQLIPYANGGGAIFHRERFLALGGFSPDFSPYYWEDTDLGYRAWKRGWRIVYDPRRKLEHEHQATIGREKRRKVQRTRSRNHWRFVWRNLSDLSLGAQIFWGILPEIVALLLRLRLRRLGWFLWDLAYLPRAAAHRRAEAQAQRKTDRELAKLWAESQDLAAPKDASP